MDAWDNCEPVATMEVIMPSDLTNKIDDLGIRTRQIEGPWRTQTDNNLIELASLVHELSRKVDKLTDE